MHWDWVTYLMLVGAVCAALAGMYVVFAEGNPFGLLWLLLAAALGGGMLMHNWAYHRDQHDAQARAQLQRQGFNVVEALTTDHQATIALGACQRTLVMKRTGHIWHLYVDQPDGQTVFYPPATAKKAGLACSSFVR